MAQGPCAFRGCEYRIKTRGLCNGHYLQLQRGQTLRPASKHVGPVDERFWRKVDKSGECWTWTGSRNHKGYGRLSTPDGVRLTHALSWELHFGAIPAGKWVLHRCDNPPCVNPDHLWVGTAKENTADMIAKGRHNYAGLALGRSLRHVTTSAPKSSPVQRAI